MLISDTAELSRCETREIAFRTKSETPWDKSREPKVETNKVRDDAVHLVAGFEHEARINGHWKFTRWDLVDLAQFKVKLKAEFQRSNRDIYRPEATIATSAK